MMEHQWNCSWSSGVCARGCNWANQVLTVCFIVETDTLIVIGCKWDHEVDGINSWITTRQWFSTSNFDDCWLTMESTPEWARIQCTIMAIYVQLFKCSQPGRDVYQHMRRVLVLVFLTRHFKQPDVSMSPGALRTAKPRTHPEAAPFGLGLQT